MIFLMTNLKNYNNGYQIVIKKNKIKINEKIVVIRDDNYNKILSFIICNFIYRNHKNFFLLIIYF